jgi:hypothetical protein
MFARFEDFAAVLLGMHVVWKCGSVCLSIRLSGNKRLHLQESGVSPEGLDVNAVRSCETLGRSNPATQLHIPDNLIPQYNIHYKGFEGTPDPLAARSEAGVCDRSLAGIAGSNPTRGVEVSCE